MWGWRRVGKAKSLLTVPFLLVLLLLPSCFIIPIPIGLPVREDPAHYAARLEPPAQYNHPYNGPVVERVVPAAEVRTLCLSMGSDLLATACSLHSNGTCYIVVPSDGKAPVSNYRRHEIAHCNGWPADHPHEG